MVVGINIEAPQNTAGFIYFGKKGALPVYSSVISHTAKDSEWSKSSDQSYVASKALQAVACCVYTAHCLVLQTQQAHTSFCQSPPTLLRLLSLLRVYSRLAASPLLSDTQTVSGTITEGKGNRSWCIIRTFHTRLGTYYLAMTSGLCSSCTRVNISATWLIS